MTHPTSSTVVVAHLATSPRSIAVGPTGIYWTVAGPTPSGTPH